MHRRTALKLPLFVAAAAALSEVPRASAAPPRWPADRANAWYAAQGWPVGANYVTSTAVNQLEMFQPQTFDPRRIDGELRLAQQIGFNTVRVFLHDQLWAADRTGFSQRLGQFVSIAASHNIKPLFVLFDSCWDPRPRLGRQRAPIPGVHNSGWVQSPGAERLQDPAYTRVLQSYVTGVVGLFRSDPRVLGWDLWNEPDNPARDYRKVESADKLALVTAFLPHVFQWARTVNPIQPLTSGVWQGHWRNPGERSAVASLQLEHSDVISFHSYGDPDEFEARIGELTPLGRPILCTEYLARTMGSTVEGILPVAKKHNVAAYNWGFIAGKTQTYFPWDSWQHPATKEPERWFSDLLYPDGRPHRENEIRVIRELTGRTQPS
ncbi:cellulase family glycosylhydrolase [Mycobacterium sp. MYCO198283]|uniref:cellulase family glycosylhydrolase n=1 Tax=Mycobacterium sp. MYCO198283 TaxID=2883505 RepID=UPI001E514428|nr:cellulase family glycosylhydrolase [Mycobacterium sp. MYCO198283]MCG5434071.1 cellulase family glycosylhydrolase [Mycobacterium sp. MYCO198283]